MSTALLIPTPSDEAAARVRSDALTHCLEQVLTQVLGVTDLLCLQVSCPLLMSGPVVVERPTGRPLHQHATARAVSISVLPIPAGQHVLSARLWVTASSDAARAQAETLPVLLAAVMDGAVARFVAESTARGALEIANRDPATGLGNRRAWLQTLRLEATRSQRTGRQLTVVVLDLDGLKVVNDTHGHAAGDDLIARAARVLVETRRATDDVCRLGGDEFGVIAPDTDALQARKLAARLRLHLQQHQVPISLGWATSSEGGGSLDDLWQQADAAMYADKRSRRP